MDVLSDHVFIQANGGDTVSSRPEVFLSEWAFLGEKIVHPDGALPFEETHDVRHRMLGWNLKNHVHVIRASITFQHFYFFLLGQFSDEFSNLDTDRPEQDFLAIFWYNDHVVCAIPYYVAL